MKHQALGRTVANVLVVLAGLAGATVRAQTNTDTAWTTTWPSIGEASSVILDPANPLRLFAGTQQGVANSQDGGRSWNLLAGSPPSSVALALDPSDASRLFAGSSSGVFRSTDGGAHFSLMGAHQISSISALAIDPSHPQTIYAAGFGADVHKSADGGSAWQSLPAAAPLTRAIASLIVDPENGNNVFAGIGDWQYSYYYYSTVAELVGSHDAGQTWRIFLDSSQGVAPVQALAFDPRSSQIIYAAKGPFVYRSRNGGASWKAGTFRLGSVVRSLVVDSLNPDTVYAATDYGVYWSVDAGAHWAALPAPPSLDVRALALDAGRQVLHAATALGVYETDLTSAASPPFPCRPGGDALCLLGSRFRVSAQAWDPRTSRFTNARPNPQSDGFGYFSLPDFTRSLYLPEILVKMIEADIPPWNSDWIFFGGLTDVWYMVTVTDTRTGKTRSYENDPNAPYCGGADTSAFPVAAALAGAPLEAMPVLRADGDALALLSGRFQLTLSATDPRAARSVSGRATGNDQFGYFSLPDLTGDPAIPEVVVKMIDARPLGGGFWFFQSGLTSVPYTLHLLDTVTGLSRTYESSGPFCSSSDTGIPDAH